MNALLIIAHGSRNPESNLETEQLVARVRGSLDTFDQVSHAFLELAEPGIEDAFNTLIEHGADNITVLPLFLARGNHVARDVPEIIEKIRDQRPELQITMTPHIGASEGFPGLVATHLKGG